MKSMVLQSWQGVSKLGQKKPKSAVLNYKSSALPLSYSGRTPRIIRGGYYALVKRAGKQFRRSFKTKDRKLAERLLIDLKAKIGALRISDDADLNFRQVANGNEFASAVPGRL